MSKIRSPACSVVQFFEEKGRECVDLITWVFFHFRRLWNEEQRVEYRLFSEIKCLSASEASPQIFHVFREKISTLCRRFSCEDIATHVKRLNWGKLGDQPYFRSSGDEKVIIKAHEVFELLAMKWERGVPIDRVRGSAFWPAHRLAIRVENIFYQALAFERKIPLSKAALEYCRICDDRYLTYPIDFSSFKLDLEMTQNNLTKNSKALPKDPVEIDHYCTFFSQHLKGKWLSRYRIGLCQRYLFSCLYSKYPGKELYLIAFLRALEGDEIYQKHSLKHILNKLEEHLNKYCLPQFFRENSICQERHFFVKNPQEIPFAIRENYSHLKKSF